MKTFDYDRIRMRALFCSGFLFFAILTCAALGQTVKQNSDQPKISQRQLEQLESMGIDFSDRDAAIQKARDLGIPETEIQNALKQYGGQLKITTSQTETDSIQTEEEIPISNETTDVERTEGSAVNTVGYKETAKLTVDESEMYAGKGRWSGLRYYGYDIFETKEGITSPIEIGPVDPGYPIGNGDVLRLIVWGESEFQYEFEVNREGNIVIPQVGQIFVAGTRLENLRETLKNYLSKFYSGLAKDPPTSFMDITLARLRTNQIYIMGEVRNPGVNSVSSYATAFNVMYAVGGPNINGSLRDVRILREGKIIARIDMYDYILKGNSTDDRRLQHNDIVFVPPREITIGIRGEILRPGIYEIVKNETLQDIISMAGGLMQTAYSFRAQIDRIVPFEARQRGKSERELIDVDIDDVIKNNTRIMLSDGDIVTIFPISDIMENHVDIEGGGIERPGRYELSDRIITLSDLISEADSLTGDAYLSKADIIRTREDFTEQLITVNLENVLRGNPDSDIELTRWDRIHVYSRREMVEPPQITLNGFVTAPGTYPLYDNTTVYDLLFKYSGLQDSLRLARTFMGHGDIYRLREDGRTRYTIQFNLYDEWNKLTESSIVLEPEDEVIIYEKEITEIRDHIVNLHGEVKYPGEYRWEDNMKVNDLILKGGGFTPRAWFLDIEVSRVPQEGIKGESISQTVKVKLYDGKEYPKNPEEVISSILNGNTSVMPFTLEPNDHVFVRANPNYNPLQVVSISGEIQYPGFYSLQNKNEHLSSIIIRAGGTKESAFLQGGQLIRNGERVFIDFSKIVGQRNSKEDIVLLQGDEIIIPPRISTVMVTGEVFNPGFYKFVEGLRVKDYLNQTGGRTENSGIVYITQPTGRTYQLGFLRNPKVLEGAVITVHIKPQKEESQVDWSETVIDTFALLSGAMTIIYLAYSINN
ncbi:SLBB domain-containing protein [Candidatus Latescibacterota bacterium]